MSLLHHVMLAFLMVTHSQALQLDFPWTIPTANRNNTFNWKKEANDQDNLWLRTQKLDGPTGASAWSDGFVRLNTSLESGSSAIFFNRTGLFNIGVFSDPGNPNLPYPLLLPILTLTVTVSVSNGTFSSTIPVIQSMLPPSISATPNLSSKSTGVHIALIVGIIAIIAVVLSGLALCIYYRRRRARVSSNWSPKSFSKTQSPLTPSNTTASFPAEPVEQPPAYPQDTASSQDSARAVIHNQSALATTINMAQDILQLGRSSGREIIQHEDSGWRPLPSDVEQDTQAIELPPTYDDSTRRIGSGQNGERGGTRWSFRRTLLLFLK